jgi:hypothetical protein
MKEVLYCRTGLFSFVADILDLTCCLVFWKKIIIWKINLFARKDRKVFMQLRL